MSAFNVCLVVILFVLNGKPILSSRQCPEDRVDFVTKVENSSIVVYGEAKGKAPVGNSRSIFDIQFRIDCILKGPPLPRDIVISQAGRIEGKTYCQKFRNSWVKFVAFLEASSSNDSTIYTPSDFVEVALDDDDDDEFSHDLLINTCDLQQQEPIDDSSLPSLNKTCPAVSTNSSCIRTTLKPKIEKDIGGSGYSLKVIPGGSQHGVDDFHARSGTVLVDVDAKTGAAASINLSIFLILAAIAFMRLY